jgi:crossover junction endodeoxyribonuclease RuvC
MSVMALDLSLNSTGIAIYNKHKQIGVSVIKTKCKDHMAKTLQIRKCIFKKIKKYKIQKVFIEGQSYGSKGQAVLSIAQLHGVIMYCLIKKKIPYECIPPTQVKKYITGKGNCKKSLILKSLYKFYHIDIDQEDMADSVAVLLTGMKVPRRKKHG